MAAWNGGADSGGLLYYLVARPWVQLGGGSALAAQLFSAACMFLAAVVWYRVLTRLVSPALSAGAVALVWLSAPTILIYLSFVRFYAMFLLAAACAVWATVAAAKTPRPGWRLLFVCFAAHSFLVLTHMLGIVYSGLVVLGVLISLPRKRALPVSAAAVVSWLWLLPCIQAIRSGSANGGSLFLPRFQDVLRFDLKDALPWPVVLLALAGFVLLLRRWHQARLQQEPDKALLLAVSVLFLLAPCVLYLLSILVRPIFTERYLIPFYLGAAVCCALALTQVQQLVERRWPAVPALALPVSLLCILVLLHVTALHRLRFRRLTEIQVAALPQSAVVVVQDPEDYFELQNYLSTPSRRFAYLIPPGTTTGMMPSLLRSGYDASSLQTPTSFLATHPDFFYLSQTQDPALLAFFAAHGCQLQARGVIGLWYVPNQLFHFDGCSPAASDAARLHPSHP